MLRERLLRVLSSRPIFILLSVLFLALLGQSCLEVRGRVQRLERLRAEVEALRGKRTELGEELTYRQSESYIEKEAREQLNYTKENERIVILPDLEEEKEGEVSVRGSTTSTEVPHLGEREIPSWQKNAKDWRLLFLGD